MPIGAVLLHHGFEAMADHTPDALAIIGPSDRLTYGQVEHRANQLARRLLDLGACRDAPVAIVAEKGWEQVVGALAVLKAGAAYLPVDADLPGERLRQLLELGEVKVVLTQPNLVNALPWPAGLEIVPVAGGDPGGSIRRPEVAGAPDALAYVIFTSGSTGLPKGVMIEHRAAVNTILDRASARAAPGGFQLNAPACPAEWTTSEQRELYEAVLRLARSLPHDPREHDREQTFPRPAWERCAAFGIQGLPLPPELGGGGADVVTTVLALEALGQGCGDGGLLFSINAHMWAVEIPLWHHGSPEQQRDWLPRLCSGELIGAHAMTEPDSGSDAFALSTTARQTDGGYLLNGSKSFVTNAPVADLLLLFAHTSPGIGPYGISAFLVPVGTPGCAIGRPIDKLGLRSSPMAEVTLSDCFLPDSALLGKPGQGGEIFQLAMSWERACIMATQLGVM